MSTAKPNTYHCESQQRVLRVLMSLFGHEILGLSPSQVAKANGITPGNTTRDLWNLERAGLVERLPSSDNVRISPRLGSKALATLTAFDQAQRQLTDLQARYTRPQ
jgi:DNA-binding MarR family transcriptional regulator